MAFTLHATPPASFSEPHDARFPTIHGSDFDIDVETQRDGTALVSLIGLRGSVYQLRGALPRCGPDLRVDIAWTQEYVMLRFEGHEVARVPVS